MGLTSLLASVVTVAITSMIDPPDDGTFHRFQLENGVRIVIVHVPDAPRQSTFSFLPLHLGNDGPDRPQWSHLLEHHLIRSTDGTSDPMMFNGETGGNAMRLDSYVVPNRWPDALRRHAAWMQARTFQQDVHDRETGAIAQEEQGVAMTGYTHKFALAAWNQVVRHGRTHAEVHRDVSESKLDDVHAYAAAHLPLDERVMVATIGPTAPDEARKLIAEHLGALPRVAGAMPAATRDGDRPRRVNATWDLPRRHIIVWRRLPHDEIATIAAATAVSHASMAMLMQGRLKPAGLETTLILENVPSSEGRYFVVIAAVTDRAEVDEVNEAILSTLESAPWAAANTVALLAKELRSMPHFEAEREQVPRHVRHVIEPNWLIQRMQIEFATGATTEEFAVALEQLKVQDLERFTQALKDATGGVVVLEPKGD